jgi:hypothetical protein
MNQKTITALEKKVQILQKQLAELGPVMRGSVVKIGTKNKQYYFSLNKNKKTKLIYLGDKKVERAQYFSENYKKLLSIVEEMTVLNMEILKERED